MSGRLPILTANQLPIGMGGIRHIGEWQGWAHYGFKPMCEVWPTWIPKRYRRRQRLTTNGGLCQACEAVARRLN